ncbi:MAG TPA: glycosyltransferase family 87 protein [Candidatus Binataceae bacterium]|nr:glycosyltransferase family 87 protein [Candidatus Binataceae bacterium]
MLIEFRVMVEVLKVRTAGWDYCLFYSGALALRRGLNPYTDGMVTVARQIGVATAYLPHVINTPAFLLCFEPLTLIPIRSAYWVWFALNVGVLALALKILLDWKSTLESWAKWNLVALVLLYPAMIDQFLFAQAQIVVLATMVLMMRWVDQGDDRAGGIIFALAGLLRVYPLTMGGYLLVRRRWRAISWAAVAFLCGALVTVIAVGTARCASFVNAIGLIAMPTLLRFTTNIATSTFIRRCFWYAYGTSLTPSLDLVCRSITVAAIVILLILTTYATASSAGRDDREGRRFSLWIVTTLMIAPLAWTHYMILLSIPFVRIVAVAHDGRASLRTRVLAIASYAVFVIGRLSPWYMLQLPMPIDHRAGVLAIVTSESGFVSIVLAFAAAYWFAIDDPEIAVSTYRKTTGTVGAVKPGVPLVEANPQSGTASTGSLGAPA